MVKDNNSSSILIAPQDQDDLTHTFQSSKDMLNQALKINPQVKDEAIFDQEEMNLLSQANHVLKTEEQAQLDASFKATKMDEEREARLNALERIYASSENLNHSINDKLDTKNSHVVEDLYTKVSLIASQHNHDVAYDKHQAQSYRSLKIFKDNENLLEGTHDLHLMSRNEHNSIFLLNSMGCAMIEFMLGKTTAERRILWANDAYFNFMGIDASNSELCEEFMQMRRVVHPDDINSIINYYNEIEESKQPLRLKYRLLHRCGYYLFVEAYTAFLGYNKQNYPIFESLLLNITADNKRHTAFSCEQRDFSEQANASEMIFEYDANIDLMIRKGNYKRYVKEEYRIAHNYLSQEVYDGNVHVEDIPKLKLLLTDKTLVDRNTPASIKIRLRENIILPRLIGGNIEADDSGDLNLYGDICQHDACVAHKSICSYSEDSFKDDESNYLKENNFELRPYQWHKVAAIAYIDNLSGHLKVTGKVTNIEHYESRIKVLQNESKLDPLTKLFNVNTMNRHCMSLLDLDGDESHSLILFDIHAYDAALKSYGQAFCNHILKLVAEVARKTFRHSDYIARLSDSIFAIMLRDVSKQQSQALAQNFMYNLKYKHEALAHDFNLSGSMGVALYPDDAPCYASLLKAAHAALKAAKKQGKDQIVVFESSCSDENIKAAAKRLCNMTVLEPSLG